MEKEKAEDKPAAEGEAAANRWRGAAGQRQRRAEAGGD